MGTPAERRGAEGDLEDLAQLWKDFGRDLEALRIKKGWNKSQLADNAKVARATVMTLEQGGRHQRGAWELPNPQDDVLGRLAGALGVNVDQWFTRVGHYAARPQTKASRRGEALRLPPIGAPSPDAPTRADFERIEQMLERIAVKLGVDLDEEFADEAPRRRRGKAG